MAAKGSKYARKHFVELEKQTDKNNEASAFLSIIYDDTAYLETFDALSLENQIKAYQTLKKLSEIVPRSSEEKKIAQMSLHKIQKINARAGLRVVKRIRYPLNPDELHVIRMDCYGCVDIRRPHLLSKYYTQFLKRKLSKAQSPQSYDLGKAPAWKIFRQFQNFRDIEENLKQYMAHQRLHPEMLEVMGVQDFSDLIFQAFKKSPKDRKASFTKSDRNEFVKELAKEKGAEIEYILKLKGVDERYAHSLLNAMKLFGVTDASRVIVTEPYFTARVLADLQKANISCDNYQIGTPVPEELVNQLMLEDKGMLLAARNELGELLNKSDFPSFEVHHKVTVGESGRLGGIARVNYKRNLLLVLSKLHTEVLHAFDKILKTSIREAYQRRLEFEDQTIVFMLGFTKETQIMHAWQNTPKDQEREEKDQKYIVSYEEVLFELIKNREKFEKSDESSIDVETIVNILRHKHKGRM